MLYSCVRVVTSLRRVP